MTNNEPDVGFIEEEKEVSNGMTVATFTLPSGSVLKVPMPIDTARWIAQQLARPSPLPFTTASVDGVRLINLRTITGVTFQAFNTAGVEEIKKEVGKHCPLRPIGAKKF